MPVYLFTFHAYRSWMPDHPRGYTKRGVGYLPSDPLMAKRYEQCAADPMTLFDRALQKAIVEHVLTIPQFIELELHAVTTEPSHIHTLCAWRNDRTWESVRVSIKSSITRKLAQLSTITSSLHLSRGASRKHVVDLGHFQHLVHVYLPKHNGVSWFAGRGWTNDEKP